MSRYRGIRGGPPPPPVRYNAARWQTTLVRSRHAAGGSPAGSTTCWSRSTSMSRPVTATTPLPGARTARRREPMVATDSPHRRRPSNAAGHRGDSHGAATAGPAGTAGIQSERLHPAVHDGVDGDVHGGVHSTRSGLTGPGQYTCHPNIGGDTYRRAATPTRTGADHRCQRAAGHRCRLRPPRVPRSVFHPNRAHLFLTRAHLGTTITAAGYLEDFFS